MDTHLMSPRWPRQPTQPGGLRDVGWGRAGSRNTGQVTTEAPGPAATTLPWPSFACKSQVLLEPLLATQDMAPTPWTHWALSPLQHRGHHCPDMHSSHPQQALWDQAHLGSGSHRMRARVPQAPAPTGLQPSLGLEISGRQALSCPSQQGLKSLSRIPASCTDFDQYPC